MDAADARVFLAAGARAVQIGTALFHDPTGRATGIATEPRTRRRETMTDLRSPAARGRAGPRSALRRASTRTPRCCATGGSTTTSPGSSGSR